MHKTRTNCNSEICVLDILEPVFRTDAANIAMSYTCFPMDCTVAHKQAQDIIDLINNGCTTGEALNIIQKKIDESYERI